MRLRFFLPIVLLVLIAACGDSTPSASTLAGAVVPGETEVVAPPTVVVEPTATPEPPPLPTPLPWAPPPTTRSARPAPEISAAAAVVLDEASASVLYEKNGFQPLSPASLTKIATLILALEKGDPDAWVETDVDSSTMRGSTVMGLEPGDRFRLRDLEYGLMLPSGNDAALAIGRFLSGSDAAFVGEMNGLLRRLGLNDGHFSNPHGLGAADHVVSAYEVAMLSRYGMSLPGFKEIVNTPSWTARGSRELRFGNINTFLTAYRSADGVKTGYTRRAGFTLAASATRNGRRIYVVVLNAPNRTSDAVALMDWAFSSHAW